MKIKFIAPASDFASTKYTPSQRPLGCGGAQAIMLLDMLSQNTVV
jgi:hypothetical protein